MPRSPSLFVSSRLALVGFVAAGLLAACSADPAAGPTGGSGGGGGSATGGDATPGPGDALSGGAGGGGGQGGGPSRDLGPGGAADARSPAADAHSGDATSGPTDAAVGREDATEVPPDGQPPPPEDAGVAPDRGVAPVCTDDDLDGYSTGGCGVEDCHDQSVDIYPGAPETCDGIDNDCDRLIDEDFDLETNAVHCGVCYHSCLAGAVPLQCIGGECVPGICPPGTHDLDGLPDNGCEYRCEPGPEGLETCNGADDDCDGLVDEGFDPDTDPANCGGCGQTCVLDNAVPACVERACRVGVCDFAWHDVDGRPENGCEYACLPTREGVEVCDLIDNDCDGRVDEDFDLETDAANCGACGARCAYPHALAECRGAAGGCALAACEDTYWNVDAQPENGCEYRCLLTRDGVEFCDLIDNDCDGAVDEDEPERGFTCAP